MIDRITIRLGSLAKAIHEAAAKSGRTVGDEIRYRLAKSLGVRAPEMKPGNPADSSQAKAAARAAAKARWAKRNGD